MKPSLRVAGLASTVFCLLLLFGAAPSLAGCGGTCHGVACVVPGQPTPSPGYCTPAQIAQGGYEIFSNSNCSGSLYDGCRCYQPSYYQVTSNCYSTASASPADWEKPETSPAVEATCVRSEGPMTLAPSH